eukprot:1896910-Amphidinium_carterae.1
MAERVADSLSRREAARIRNAAPYQPPSPRFSVAPSSTFISDVEEEEEQPFLSDRLVQTPKRPRYRTPTSSPSVQA